MNFSFSITQLSTNLESCKVKKLFDYFCCIHVWLMFLQLNTVEVIWFSRLLNSSCLNEWMDGRHTYWLFFLLHDNQKLAFNRRKKHDNERDRNWTGHVKKERVNDKQTEKVRQLREKERVERQKVIEKEWVTFEDLLASRVFCFNPNKQPESFSSSVFKGIVVMNVTNLEMRQFFIHFFAGNS